MPIAIQPPPRPGLRLRLTTLSAFTAVAALAFFAHERHAGTEETRIGDGVLRPILELRRPEVRSGRTYPNGCGGERWEVRMLGLAEAGPGDHAGPRK